MVDVRVELIWKLSDFLGKSGLRGLHEPPAKSAHNGFCQDSAGLSGILMSGHCLLALLTCSVSSHVHRSYGSFYPHFPQCTHEPMAASLCLQTTAGQTEKVLDSGRSSSWEQLLSEAELSNFPSEKAARCFRPGQEADFPGSAGCIGGEESAEGTIHLMFLPLGGTCAQSPQEGLGSFLCSNNSFCDSL